MQLLYTILLYLIQPFIWFRLLWRSRKAPNYRKRWLERYGFCKGKVKPQGILVHAVSVGETIAAIPLIEWLKTEYPHLPITVTTMTPTGSERVSSLLGDTVSHVYLPYDLPCALNRFLNQLQPKLVIIMETELWPNLITQLYKKKIPLIIANARLSERSAKGYARLGDSIKHLLEKITLIAAQNKQDGERFLKLGLPQKQLSITGSIKYDIYLSQSQKDKIAEIRTQWSLNRPVLIAASTHIGEDDIILDAFNSLLTEHPNLLLILVPRHPERFKPVTALVAKYHFNYQLRSQQLHNKNLIPNDETQVIIGDTMGELTILYGLADIAFVGGSLIRHGGHNPLEPALHALPIIMGEHTFNFKAICQQLVQANALFELPNDKEKISNKINSLLKNSELRETTGQSALHILEQNQGALIRLENLIKTFLD